MTLSILLLRFVAGALVLGLGANRSDADPGALDSRQANGASLAVDDSLVDPQTGQVDAQQSRERQRAQRKDANQSQKDKDTPVAHVPELRDETFRLMDAYLISNLQESLGLSDEQFTKALPLVKKLQSDRRNFAKRRMQALRQLRKSLSSGLGTEASVADLLKDLKAASAEERDGTFKNLESLDAVLTPLQQAKYRVFEAEVDGRLRHLLARSQDRVRSNSR